MSHNKPPTSKTTVVIATSPLDLPTLLGELYAALRESEQRRNKLAEKIAAKNMLRDFPKFQPRWCRGKTWPKWVPVLEKIRKGERAIGDDAEERRDPPPGERLTLRDHLVRYVTRAESRIKERLGSPLWEYVVKRLEKKCGLLVDDPKFPNFADRLEEYCGDNDNDHGVKLEDRELLSNRIAELDNAGFADDLLAEIWTRFPRECERLGLQGPAGSMPHRTTPARRSNVLVVDQADTRRDWEPSTGFIRVKEVQKAERFQKNGFNMSRSRISEWAVQDKTIVEKDPATGECCYKETWVLQRWRTWSPRKPKPQQ